MRDSEIQNFLRDTKDHQLQIIRDDGLYRHIRMKKPNTFTYHYDLVTWPGHLCYTGDMGTFTFTRLSDMFEFFRGRDGREFADIDRRYWDEKATSYDKRGDSEGGSKEFNPEGFTAYVTRAMLEWMRDAHARQTLDKQKRRELWEAVRDEVLSKAEYGESAALTALFEFRWMPDFTRGSRYWSFDPEGSCEFRRYTHTFTWACCAIALAIQKYDEAKAQPAPADAPV